MKIGILIYPNCSLWSATAPYEILNRANTAQKYFYGTKADRVTFDVEYISMEDDQTFFAPTFDNRIKFCKDLTDNAYDMILVPGFASNPERVIETTKATVTWIRELHAQGVCIVSFCSGSLLLALAGIIQNRLATTHWMLQPFFEQKFPDIPLDFSKLMINHGDIMMSGSATSYQVLVLNLIEEVMGRTVAVGVSKVYLIDLQKDSPESYRSLNFNRNHNDPLIKKVQEYMDKNSSEMISLDDISLAVSINKRTLIRRFKNALDDTPLNYLQKLKVEKAKYMLENIDATFEEIAFRLGYEDVSSFRKIFIKHTGILPMKYKARYQII